MHVNIQARTLLWHLKESKLVKIVLELWNTEILLYMYASISLEFDTSYELLFAKTFINSSNWIYLESLSLIKNYTKFERKYERRLIFNVSIWICLKKKKSIKNLFNMFVEKEKLISNFERGYLTW